jgi:hypothetical protein
VAKSKVEAGNVESKSVRIGSVIYAIRDAVDLDRDREAFGMIDLADCTILISGHLHGQFRRKVLWHEILHGVLYAAGCDEHDDEKLVGALSEALPRLIQDNPWLVADLIDKGGA